MCDARCASSPRFHEAIRHHPCCLKGAGAPEFLVSFALEMRARGTPDARAHPQPRVQSKKHTSVVATVAPEASGVPHAVVLRLASCSPRERPLGCHRRLRGTFPLRSEVKRAGRISQDHTTWAGAEYIVMRCVATPQANAQRGPSCARDDGSHALCTRNAPCYRRSRLTLPRHRIPPRVS